MENDEAPAAFALRSDCVATVFTACFEAAGVSLPVGGAALTDVVRVEASPLGLVGGRGATSGSLFGMIAASGLIASVASPCGASNVAVSALDG